MGSHYPYLTLEERRKIGKWYDAGECLCLRSPTGWAARPPSYESVRRCAIAPRPSLQIPSLDNFDDRLNPKHSATPALAQRQG